jgi:nitric-oxide synthase, bacterial
VPRERGEREALLGEVETFLALAAREHILAEPLIKRLRDIRRAIARHGRYRHTDDELAFGARVAWRNSKRCIGRRPWSSLHVRDMRHLRTARQVFEACVEHVRVSTNGGRIRPTITVFAPRRPGTAGIRIWNPQLIRYAGYRQADGSVLGDPMHVDLTEFVQARGWRGRGTSFDVLPLVIQMPDADPEWFDMPADAVLEVPLTHPTLPWFGALGLKWHALPAVSNMRLEIGGIHYTAAPFSGWYMGTEVGARNLADEGRYNLLPVIADRLGLDCRSDRHLWKDRALVELNVAVLHSFALHGVTMVDHHSASRQFMRHVADETRAGRQTPAEWSWIVPPMSGSTTPVFHRPFRNVTQKPNFYYQPSPWKAAGSPAAGCPFQQA